MADRSKKRRRRPAPRPRPEAAPAPEPARQAAPKVDRRREPETAPPAPWGKFPLVELVVLVALVLIVVGFFAGGQSSPTLIVAGLALGSLAGLELAIREHFSGYRSHTALLASAAGLIVLAILYFAAPGLVSPAIRIVVALAVAGLAAGLLLRAFRARTGRSIKLR
ncbi:hypothetical protein HJD18_04360 [Thermoleophilia bacterium SCSIO 60948]|nr:hypothetical protein HJD18_04360 [Thermoleophilia bacterium SCSIO 60948]